ncbi:MAG TPA: hypothetical protein O0W90_04430 [Methanocorpusculum sp.]|nr:hypothetical protein [Methanocorpusculum sp.]
MNSPKDTKQNNPDERKGPGLMYYVLMLVAIGCIIYGVYGWATGKW